MKRISLLSIILLSCSTLFVSFGQSSLQRSVYFDSNSAVLKAEGEQSLKEVINFLAQNPTLQIELTGYTDNDGSDALNQKLATQRVQTVQNYLLLQNTPNNKIVTKAFGKVGDKDANINEEVKKRNRRVDIIVTFGEKITNIASLYKALENPIQTFKIKTDRDTLIRGEKGTLITIPKNAFKGVPSGSVIDFKLKEAYSVSDIIKENLNSMSGNKLLETGGMIYTDATFNSQKLSLQRDLIVKFNSVESQREDMRLFRGDRDMTRNGRMNWEVVNPEDEYLTIFSGYDKLFSPYIIINENTNKLITLPELCDTSGCYPLIVGERKQGEFEVRPNMSNVCAALAMYLSDRPNIPQHIPADKLHRIAFREAYALYDVNTLSELKTQRGSRWDSLMQARWNYLQEIEKQEKLAKEQERQSLLLAQNQARIEQKQNDNFNKTFPMALLGWYNCDAYTSSQLAITEIITDKIENLDENNYGDIRVILKSRKSIIQKTQIFDSFKIHISIPKNEVAVIVALKVEKGESFMAIADCVGRVGQTLKLDFRKMTTAEIREKLNFLNK